MDSLAIALANYGIVVLAVVAAASWLLGPRTDRLRYAVEGVFAVLLAGALALLTGLLWTDPRPFVVDHSTPLISHGTDNGFPSDHTALAFAVAAVVLRHDRRYGVAALVLAALVGASRVYVGVHHWPDIIGGAVVGLLAAALAVRIAAAVTPVITRRVAQAS